MQHVLKKLNFDHDPIPKVRRGVCMCSHKLKFDSGWEGVGGWGYAGKIFATMLLHL